MAKHYSGVTQPRFYIYLIAISTGTVFTSNARCDAPIPTVDELIQYHKASVDAVQTFHCKFKSINRDKNGQPSNFQFMSGEYWRGPEGTRYKWIDKAKTGEGVSRDGRSVSLITNREQQKPSFFGSIVEDKGIPQTSDPWHRAMFEFTKGLSGTQPFDVRRKDWTGKFHALTRSDKNTILYEENSLSGSLYRYHFSTQFNYLIEKFEGNHTELDGSPGKYVGEIKKFRQVQPGVYFPEEVMYSWSKNGEVYSTEHFFFTDITVNGKLPVDIFEIKHPPTTYVQDLINHIEYTVGPNGEKHNSRPYNPTPPPPSGDASAKPGTETKEEPTPWTWWLLPASLAVLFVALVLWAFRKYRLRSQATDTA
jgi:hypothetical protein